MVGSLGLGTKVPQRILGAQLRLGSGGTFTYWGLEPYLLAADKRISQQYRTLSK